MLCKTAIGDWAFEDSNVVGVTFASNSSLTSIGIGAFADSGLTMINLPASLVSIENWAFSNCSSLIVTYNGNNLKTIGDAAFYNTKLTTNTQIPASVTTIGDWAFYNSAFSSDFALHQNILNDESLLFFSCF